MWHSRTRKTAEVGEAVLRGIGVRDGLTVLDFGCGRGNYAIPCARIVGRSGRVYALDKNRAALDEVMRRARREGLDNITRMETSGAVHIATTDAAVDVVLLYDIFWYFTLEDPRLSELLSEVDRVAKPGALVSVYPKHINAELLRATIEAAGFRFRDTYSGTLIHDGRAVRDHVLNFVKVRYHERS
jgi:ubiquinone/menaquinone biosynthesis C-methylase UbiE